MKGLLFTLGIYLVFIALGCSGCGGVKGKIADKSSIPNVEPKQSDTNNRVTVFPPDFPKIYPMPEYLPKSEILIDYSTTRNIIYLFGDNGEFKGEFKEPQLFGQALLDSFKLNKKYYLINKNDNAFFKELTKVGFKIDERDITRSKYFNFNGRSLDFIYDKKTNKIAGLYIKNNIYLLDDEKRCIIKEISLTKFYNYLGNWTLTLSQNECQGLIYYQNSKNIFSTIDECTCSGEDEEQECALKCHRIYDVSSKKTIDINPFKFLDKKYLEWDYIPLNIAIGDDIIHYTYYNHYKQLRVIIDLNLQKIYFKEYDLLKDFDGKYTKNAVEAFKDLHLPDGTKEDFTKYDSYNF